MEHIILDTGAAGNIDRWDYLSLSDTHVLDRLIRNRHKADAAFYTTVQPDSGYGDSDLPGLQEEVFLTYIDLDCLIEQTLLTAKQTEIISRLMEGYTIWDIAEMDGISVFATDNIRAHYAGALRKLARRNQAEWENLYGVRETGPRACTLFCRVKFGEN